MKAFLQGLRYDFINNNLLTFYLIPGVANEGLVHLRPLLTSRGSHFV